MNNIKPLNQQLDGNTEDVEVLLTELIEREEFACTGQVCAGNVEGV